MTALQFDLGLSLLRSGRLDLGLREYRRGLKKVRDRHPLRQLGLCHVALADLKEAARNDPTLGGSEALRQVRESLETTLARAKTANLQTGRQ